MRGAQVDGRQRRAERAGTHNFAIEHSREFQIRRVSMASGHEIAFAYFPNRLARDFPFRRGRYGVFGGHHPRQGLALRKLRIADRAAAGALGNFSIGRHQLARVHIPPLRGEFHQHVARRSRHSPEMRTHLRRRAAPERAHIQRRQLRVAHDHVD